LNLLPTDFTDQQWQQGTSDDDILEIIRGGGAVVGKSGVMPAWERVLSDAEIDSMLEYIRRFAREERSGSL